MLNNLNDTAPRTVTNFKKWLLEGAYKGDKKKLLSFSKLPHTYQCISFTMYLEKIHGTPIVAAINYYNSFRYYNNYADQLKSMIMYEFSRIEQGKETLYNIF